MNDEQAKSALHARGAPLPLDAKQLFQGRRELAIHFGKDVYRLRITRNDKLILTK